MNSCHSTTGALFGYKYATSTPTYIQYQGSPYYHGALDAWTYLTTLQIAPRVHLQLEADEDQYLTTRVGEIRTDQWLERASLDFQLNREMQLDVGLRRLVGSFLATASVTPGFSPVTGGNVSAALHFLARDGKSDDDARGIHQVRPLHWSTQGNLTAQWRRVSRCMPGMVRPMVTAAPLPFAGALAIATFRLLHTFAFGDPSTGSLPAGPLITDSRGVIYGTTQGGGRSEFSFGGTVFALTPSGNGYAYKVLHYFTGDDHPSLDGDQPASGVTLDSAGNLYGTTLYGGAAAGAGAGTVFELQPRPTRYEERVLHRFTGGNTGSTDGSNPNAAPLVDSAGSLYGTTASGGTGACTIAGPGCGTVYELEHSGTNYRERILYRFKGGSDGATPQAALIADRAGDLYGTTQYGGSGCPNSPTLGCGTVFELTPGPAGSNGYHETVLYRFQGGATDGVAPLAALYLDPGGTLYGTTDLGGAGICAPALFTYPSCGTAFMLQRSGPSYVETVLHNFIGGAGDGYRPESALVPGPDGLLYGTTIFGGTNKCFVYAGYNFGCGTVFAMSTIGGVSLLHSFGPGIGGSSPNGLLIDADGNIFGTTPQDWTAKGEGAAFEIAQ